jgi:spermidine synthase
MMLHRYALHFTLAWALLFCAVAAGAERLLLVKKSPYNNILVSEDDRGLRILRFEPGGARQSVVKPGDPEHLELPYTRVIPVAFAFVEKPKNVLVVGLGGGTIPAFVRRHFPQANIDAVDIDPGVVEVARSHFGFREDAKLRAHVEDGRRFIERSERRYDIIFLDAFGADSVPYSLATREFLDSVRRTLAPRGAVIGNLWSSDYNPIYDSMLRTYRAVYDEVSIVDVPGGGNKILVALPWKAAFSTEELVRRSGQLNRRLSLQSDLGDIVKRGYRRIDAELAKGSVLYDAQPPADPARR